MLKLLRDELESYHIFDAPDHPFINALVRAVPFNTVPTKMKMVMAISHLTNFAAQFRRNIELWDGTPVPVNSLSFVIADSGANKDSSNNKIRKCFKPGYEQLEKYINKENVKQAINAAIAAEEDPELAQHFDVYKSYLKPVPPIFMSITTGPGLVQHINDIGDLPIASSFLYSGEISDELANNPNAMDNIKILSEVYDLGIKEATYTKSTEFRSKEIDGQPVSALFVGSPGHILYDETTRKKFHVAFMSKLARRTWFCYTPERIPEPDFSQEADPIQAMLDYRTSMEVEAKEAREAVADHIKEVTRHNLDRADQPVPVTEEVFRLFEIYKRYNREVVDASANQESTYALIRAHLQWKALKLAGAIAIMENDPEITQDHYLTAIRFCELLDHDMEEFEYDLNKAPHEQMADYMHTIVNSDNKAIISTHDIKKKGFSSTVSLNKLRELVTLCAGYDSSGIYEVVNEGGAIQYEPLVKTDVLGLSFKPIDTTELNKAVEAGDEEAVRNAKHKISVTTAYGFDTADTTFAELGDLLEGDFAYSPFKFKNGVRGKNNILSGTKWLVLDVDDSPITASEAHFLMGHINHHIALSSDPNNEYKFRVLIELDSPVELSAIAWKHFYLKIAEDLALRVDPLPQSQIFFSYADRPVLSVTDGEILNVREYVMYAKDKEATKTQNDRSMTSSQKKAQLDDALETFSYAFLADNGQGSINMYRAARHAQDLGAHLEYTLELIDDINFYWSAPMPEDRIEKLKEQVTRLYNE